MKFRVDGEQRHIISKTRRGTCEKVKNYQVTVSHIVSFEN
jgi:hypothetical protein